MVMRLATAPLQNGHVSVAHVAQTTKWLHGRKRTARGHSMHTMHSFRSCASSRSRLTSTITPAVASVASLSALRPDAGAASSRARFVVGMHGAAMTHLIFAKDGAVAVELFSAQLVAERSFEKLWFFAHFTER